MVGKSALAAEIRGKNKNTNQLMLNKANFVKVVQSAAAAAAVARGALSATADPGTDMSPQRQWQ